LVYSKKPLEQQVTCLLLMTEFNGNAPLKIGWQLV
jgi:hypothetical protein